jgi:hypothetical protein
MSRAFRAPSVRPSARHLPRLAGEALSAQPLNGRWAPRQAFPLLPREAGEAARREAS